MIDKLDSVKYYPQENSINLSVHRCFPHHQIIYRRVVAYHNNSCQPENKRKHALMQYIWVKIKCLAAFELLDKHSLQLNFLHSLHIFLTEKSKQNTSEQFH